MALPGPILTHSFEDEPKAVVHAAADGGLRWMLALPIVAGTEVMAVCLFID